MERWKMGSRSYSVKMKAATKYANNAYRYTTTLTQNGLEQSYEILSWGSAIGKTGLLFSSVDSIATSKISDTFPSLDRLKATMDTPFVFIFVL